jgi:ankyrin repeat protein
MVRLLLDAGADREHRSADGRTALDLAAQYNKADVVAILDENALLDRGRIVASSGGYMPPELAELCGDYVHMTPERLAVEARQKKHQEQ